MYILKTSKAFDSAHFLKGYPGKCSHLHGHRWTVEIEVESPTVDETGEYRGMVVDFHQLKKDLEEKTEYFDHKLLIEKGSLKETTMKALAEENFPLIQLPFRPTAENLARLFYDEMQKKGYHVRQVSVYETPDNCAVYRENPV